MVKRKHCRCTFKKLIMSFINSLYEKGYARELADKLENWDYEPLNEAKRVADIINKI